jgi:cyclic-di-GMP-binding protein
MPALALSLPILEDRPANPPETRIAAVKAWLAENAHRDPIDAARTIGDALAATNRVAMPDGRRQDLAEAYWQTARQLWMPLERHFAQASHPLTGPSLEAAKAALTLSTELAIAYKHLLMRESARRISFGGTRLATALVHRCLESTVRVLVNSYLAYAPVPLRTWHDAHLVYAYARSRNLHQQAVAGDGGEVTPERTYVQSLLLALANPYGFHPGQLMLVVRYLVDFAHVAKLTDVAPVHRMAKAVAIVPVGHDFPPFSANKGGTLDGSKLFLLTFDLAFQLQEQLRALEAGAALPEGVGRDYAARAHYLALLRRLLRQWAIPPARQFNRLPSRARVVMCAGLDGAWHNSPGGHAGGADPSSGLPPMTSCQVINHTPAGYALRQSDPHPTALRIGELIALRVEGRPGVQIAAVRWFRNTLRVSGLEFGCEILSDAPEAAGAAAEGASGRAMTPVVVIPGNERPAGNAEPEPPQVVVPAGTFQLEQAITLKRGASTQLAVLTKLVEQGPGYEIYEYVAVA